MLLSLGFFRLVPEEIHNASRLASPGTCLFPGSPVPLMTFAPVVSSSWAGMVRGFSQLLQAWVTSFAAEVQAALLEPDFVKLRVFPLFTHLCLQNTRKPSVSPAPSSRLLCGTPRLACLLGRHCASDSLACSQHSPPLFLFVAEDRGEGTHSLLGSLGKPGAGWNFKAPGVQETWAYNMLVLLMYSTLLPCNSYQELPGRG